jgi:type I restriction enzyme S subunit
MKNEWEKVKLGDIATYINRGIAPRYAEGGSVIINQKCIRDGVIKLEESKTYSKEQNVSKEKYLQNKDILICSTGTGTLSRVGQVKNVFPNLTVDSHVSIVRINENIADQLFIGFNLKSREKEIESLAEGSTGQTELPREKLKSLEISLPPLPVQQSIAQILSSLDDKIELLREQNKTLEALAQTLFKRWFVDFEFPNEDGKPYKSSGGKMVESELGLIPEGWRVGKLTDIADFLNGVASQKYPPKPDVETLPVIKIRELSAGISERTDKANTVIDDKYIVNSGDILFSWSGSLDIVIWMYGKGILNQHLFKVSSNEFPKWFYYYWIKEHLEDFRQIASSKAVTLGHIQRHHLDEALVVIPEKLNFRIFDLILSSNLNKQKINNSSLLKTKQLRDLLLPKLMRGEIEI